MPKIQREEGNSSRYQLMTPKGLLRIGTIADKKECRHLTIEEEPVKIAVLWATIENNVHKDQEK